MPGWEVAALWGATCTRGGESGLAVPARPALLSSGPAALGTPLLLCWLCFFSQKKEKLAKTVMLPCSPPSPGLKF